MLLTKIGYINHDLSIKLSVGKVLSARVKIAYRVTVCKVRSLKAMSAVTELCVNQNLHRPTILPTNYSRSCLFPPCAATASLAAFSQDRQS
jgi:acyl-CoA thioesterase FadM